MTVSYSFLIQAADVFTDLLKMDFIILDLIFEFSKKSILEKTSLGARTRIYR